MEIDSAGFDSSFRPEPLSLTTDGPGTFTFDNLQSIQDISAPTPTIKSDTNVGSHAAYEDALLEYSGLNEQEQESFQFSLTGSSPMKFKMDPHPVDRFAQQPQDHAAQQLVDRGQSLSADTSMPIVTGEHPPGQQAHGEFSVNGFQQNTPAPLAAMPSHAATAPAPAPQKGGKAQPMDDYDDDDDEDNVQRTYTLGREAAVALLNTPGGVSTEAELNEIDPSLLTPEETKKLKRTRRAIRNRESATASRMRRKEYIESLEKRTSELCSENAMLDLSVAEMKMREKAKAEELERVRQENNQLRAESYANRAENHQLRQDKQAIEERLKNVKLVDGPEAEALENTSGPGTWPLPKKRAPREKATRYIAGLSGYQSQRVGEDPLSPAARVAKEAAEQAAAAQAAAQQAQAAAAQAQAQAQAAAAHAAAQAQQAAAAQEAAAAEMAGAMDGGFQFNGAAQFSYFQR
jgi:hypothetical protein